MLLILCIITVERMNETVAALYNITDFSLGELLLLYVYLSAFPQRKTQPRFLLPGPSRTPTVHLKLVLCPLTLWKILIRFTFFAPTPPPMPLSVFQESALCNTTEIMS